VRIVLLHGYGSSPDRLTPVAEAIHNRFRGVEIVCPTGGVTLSDGTHAWFDDPFAGAASVEPVTASAACARLVASTDLGLNDSIVCGFSQGAAMAITVGFLANETDRPRAVVSVCGFLPEGVTVQTVGHPTLLVTGDDDEIVDPFYSESLMRQMKKYGCDVSLATVSTGHQWTPEITAIVAEWLGKPKQCSDR
jgi:predicted esterase